jgi:hypothetical protein
MLQRAEAAVTRWTVGLFMPDLARQMQAEGLFEKPQAGETPEYLVVEDNGADITIFSFSGFDVLYAGFARFEFQRVLKEIGCKANLVFLRDLNRTGFHATPDNNLGGLEFYEREVREVMERLGASRNVAIGSSSGGAAALWFSTRCKMDEAIVFGAALTADGFLRPRLLLSSLLNLRQLVREPAAYFELMVVALGAWWGGRPLGKRFGNDALMDPLGAYQRNQPDHPRVTFYYGMHSPTDAWHAHMMKEFQNVRLMPLPTGRHNTPAYLQERGQLAHALQAGMSPEPKAV